MRIADCWSALSLLGTVLQVPAAEWKVLTAGAYKPVLIEVALEFEARAGRRLTVDNDTAGALQRRIGGGEVFDLVVLTPAGIDALTDQFGLE